MSKGPGVNGCIKWKHWIKWKHCHGNKKFLAIKKFAKFELRPNVKIIFHDCIILKIKTT